MAESISISINDRSTSVVHGGGRERLNLHSPNKKMGYLSEDETLVGWLAAQSNVSASLPVLARQDIAEHGVRDLAAELPELADMHDPFAEEEEEEQQPSLPMSDAEVVELVQGLSDLARVLSARLVGAAA